ncbi:MAG: hypothetical protein ACK4NF_02890, partial [Planctomycetota bacterium]
KKLYNNPPSQLLKQVIEYFKKLYDEEISASLDNTKNFTPQLRKAIENFYVKITEFLNYYDTYLREVTKNELNLQGDFHSFIEKVFREIENYISTINIGDEIKSALEFYNLLLQFFHFKFTTSTQELDFYKKVSKLEKRFDEYYIKYQPSPAAFEVSLLLCKLDRMKIENKLSQNETKNINKLLKNISSRLDEIYEYKSHIEKNKSEVTPWTAVVIRTALFKAEITLFQLKNNLNIKEVKEVLIPDAITALNFVYSFPFLQLKWEALFRKAQLLEAINNTKDAISIYLYLAKSSSPFSSQAQEILRKYQHNVTIPTENEIINEFLKVISTNDATAVWDFYTLYMKKRNFFPNKYKNTLVEILSSFFSSSNQNLENSILNYTLYKFLDVKGDVKSAEKEKKLTDAILSLQDYVGRVKETEYILEMLNSWRKEFTEKFPASTISQAIILKDIKSKIGKKDFQRALTMLEEIQNWSTDYLPEVNILKKYLKMKTQQTITKKEIKDFIKTIKVNATGNLYLLSLSLPLLSNIAFEYKEYELLYRYSRRILPKLKENKEVYILSLEDAIKSAFLTRKYKDFNKWAEEYLTLTIPSNFVIELLKSYAIFNALRFNRKKAREFFNLFVFSIQKNKKFNFQPDFAEKVRLINSLYRTYEYNFYLAEEPAKYLIEIVCKDIEKEKEKEVKNYLVSAKMISKDIAEDKVKSKEAINYYILYLTTQCWGLRYRITYDTDIVDNMQNMFTKNDNEHLARELSLILFDMLKYRDLKKDVFKKTFENFTKAINKFYKYEKNKPKKDKFHREVILLLLYSYILTQKEIEKVKKIQEQYAPLFNLKDTRKLYKMIFSEVK